MKYANVCDIGKRDNNEDEILTLQLQDKTGFFAVADGLGGHAHGELASKCVLDSIKHSIAMDGMPTCTEESMKNLFDKSQESLLDLIDSSPAYKRMRTTMTAVLIDGDKAIWGHVGDSRLYLFRDNKIYKVTADHSVAYMSYVNGEISYDDIRKSDDQSRLIRTMGAEEKFKPEICEVTEVKPGDAFLLCTDGFWENINEKQMIKCLKKSQTPLRWIAKMVRVIRDNIKSLEDCDNFSAVTVFI